MDVNEKDYTYYFELAKGLNDNNLSKKYSELEPYKDNLKILLSEIYDIEFALKVYYEHSKEYIDNCIIFCKSLGNKKLDPENLNIIRKFCLSMLKAFKKTSKLSMNDIRFSIAMDYEYEIEKILKTLYK